MFDTTHPQSESSSRDEFDEFDELVACASGGDRRAIGAIAIALGPTLLKEARTVLGEFDDEADDVLQDFFLFLVEPRWPTTPPQGRAMRMCVADHRNPAEKGEGAPLGRRRRGVRDGAGGSPPGQGEPRGSNCMPLPACAPSLRSPSP
jgi:hypothetical protein